MNERNLVPRTPLVATDKMAVAERMDMISMSSSFHYHDHNTLHASIRIIIFIPYNKCAKCSSLVST